MIRLPWPLELVAMEIAHTPCNSRKIPLCSDFWHSEVPEKIWKQLNPQIIGKIRDGPTYSINREEVEVVCQIPSGTINWDQDTAVGRSGTRGWQCRVSNERCGSNERTSEASAKQKRRCDRTQPSQHGTLKKTRAGALVFLSQCGSGKAYIIWCTHGEPLQLNGHVVNAVTY